MGALEFSLLQPVENPGSQWVRHIARKAPPPQEAQNKHEEKHDLLVAEYLRQYALQYVGVGPC